MAIVAVEVIAGFSLYALARSAGPKPDGVANGLIRLCASTRTCDLHANRPPPQTAAVGSWTVPSSSLACWSSLSSEVAQPARARAPTARVKIDPVAKIV